METRFIIPIEDVQKAFKFSADIVLGENQFSSDFGRHDILREERDQIADTFEGKIAEFAILNFSKQFGVEPILDFNIYEDRTAIDYGQDFEEIVIKGKTYKNRCRIDIKATRSYSKWLLVESTKFWADAYILVKVHLPRDVEKKMDVLIKASQSEQRTEVVGFAYYFDLIVPNTKMPWFCYEQGSQLIDCTATIKNKKEYKNKEELIQHILQEIANGNASKLNCTLKAPKNYGYTINWLRKSIDEWSIFYNWIKESAYLERQT